MASWFDKLTPSARKAYLRSHPKSKKKSKSAKSKSLAKSSSPQKSSNSLAVRRAYKLAKALRNAYKKAIANKAEASVIKRLKIKFKKALKDYRRLKARG